LNFSSLSINSDSLFPTFGRAKGISVILHPGEVLYIPPFWFHQIIALTTRINLSVRSAAFEGISSKMYSLNRKA
jgi:uncharacterized RmlC-like cupin family protein